jgi:predicted N-acetyltransferase YhbS
LEIRRSIASDRREIETIHTIAFGNEKGPEIAELVNGLFEDETALPRLSLVAFENERLVGHILFTKVDIAMAETSVAARILAPLAILPEAQNKGVGQQLINDGLAWLQQAGVALVFVLGHPDYYPRCGFRPAGVLGFEAPYPIPAEVAGAWMVQELRTGIIGNIKGKVQCCKALDRPEHWRE